MAGGFFRTAKRMLVILTRLDLNHSLKPCEKVKISFLSKTGLLRVHLNNFFLLMHNLTMFIMMAIRHQVFFARFLGERPQKREI